MHSIMTRKERIKICLTVRRSELIPSVPPHSDAVESKWSGKTLMRRAVDSPLELEQKCILCCLMARSIVRAANVSIGNA